MGRLPHSWPNYSHVQRLIVFGPTTWTSGTDTGSTVFTVKRTNTLLQIRTQSYCKYGHTKKASLHTTALMVQLIRILALSIAHSHFTLGVLYTVSTNIGNQYIEPILRSCGRRNHKSNTAADAVRHWKVKIRQSKNAKYVQALLALLLSRQDFCMA